MEALQRQETHTTAMKVLFIQQTCSSVLICVAELVTFLSVITRTSDDNWRAAALSEQAACSDLSLLRNLIFQNPKFDGDKT